MDRILLERVSDSSYFTSLAIFNVLSMINVYIAINIIQACIAFTLQCNIHVLCLYR